MTTTEPNATTEPQDIPRYTVIQRDRSGNEVNRIDSLDELSASNLVALLDSSTAVIEGGWTTELVDPPTAAQHAAQTAEKWLSERHVWPTRTSELTAIFALIASRLEKLGDMKLPRFHLSVGVQFGAHLSPGLPDADRMAAVDQISLALGIPDAELDESGTYSAGQCPAVSIYAPKITVEKAECAETVAAIEQTPDEVIEPAPKRPGFLDPNWTDPGDSGEPGLSLTHCNHESGCRKPLGENHSGMLCDDHPTMDEVITGGAA